MSDTDRPAEDGFELVLPGDEQGTFFRWHVTDQGKDLMLIDRFTGMPVTEFFQLIEDSFDRGRAPVLLAMIATSIRAKFPTWTVERVYRIVADLSLSSVTFIDADREEDQRPPAGAVSEAETPSTPSADGSSPSSIPEETSRTSATLSVAQG